MCVCVCVCISKISFNVLLPLSLSLPLYLSLSGVVLRLLIVRLFYVPLTITFAINSSLYHNFCWLHKKKSHNSGFLLRWLDGWWREEKHIIIIPSHRRMVVREFSLYSVWNPSNKKYNYRTWILLKCIIILKKFLVFRINPNKLHKFLYLNIQLIECFNVVCVCVLFIWR